MKLSDIIRKEIKRYILKEEAKQQEELGLFPEGAHRFDFHGTNYRETITNLVLMDEPESYVDIESLINNLEDTLRQKIKEEFSKNPVDKTYFKFDLGPRLTKNIRDALTEEDLKALSTALYGQESAEVITKTVYYKDYESDEYSEDTLDNFVGNALHTIDQKDIDNKKTLFDTNPEEIKDIIVIGLLVANQSDAKSKQLTEGEFHDLMWKANIKWPLFFKETREQLLDNYNEHLEAFQSYDFGNEAEETLD